MIKNNINEEERATTEDPTTAQPLQKWQKWQVTEKTHTTFIKNSSTIKL